VLVPSNAEPGDDRYYVGYWNRNTRYVDCSVLRTDPECFVSLMYLVLDCSYPKMIFQLCSLILFGLTRLAGRSQGPGIVEAVLCVPSPNSKLMNRAMLNLM
jgi:hypothetical protein